MAAKKMPAKKAMPAKKSTSSSGGAKIDRRVVRPAGAGMSKDEVYNRASAAQKKAMKSNEYGPVARSEKRRRGISDEQITASEARSIRMGEAAFKKEATRLGRPSLKAPRFTVTPTGKNNRTKKK
jgi:hypothetical protein